MISGFNTDVECSGTVYHVQTEDKGAPHHVIMSLVYNKGTILASKREPYETAATEKQLKDKVNRQHKLICAAVKAGRIDELKEMTAASRSAAMKAKQPVAVADASPVTTAPTPSLPEPVVSTPVVEAPRARAVEPQPAFQPESTAPPDPFANAPVIEAVEILEEYPEILSAEAIEVVSELSGQSRPADNKLGVEILGDVKFKGGDRSTLNIMICRGSDRHVVDGAQIMIKILGSSFRPVIFHAKSDQNGLARIHLQVPQFSAGRAALLVRAIADGEEVEMRRMVSPNS